MKKIWNKGNKLFLEDGQVIFLTKDMKEKFSIGNREYITDEEFEALIYFRVKLSAYNMLLKRDYFKKEFSDKLRAKHNFPLIVERVVEYFVENGHLNDVERAYSYARVHSNYGKRKLSYIFQQMGVSKDIIEDIVLENEDEEIENIQKLWLKLGNKDYNKKVASLIRKGFVYSDIKRAISSLEEED